MTAHSPILAQGDHDAWAAATDAANAWRGEAIQLFAKAELAVSETLRALGEQPGKGAKVRLRRLVGQRFEDLATALSDLDSERRARASGSLARFRDLEEVRPYLCHGVAKVALDRRGFWIAILKLVDLRASRVSVHTRSFEEREARVLIEDLSKRTRDLLAALQSVRSKLAPNTTPA